MKRFSCTVLSRLAVLYVYAPNAAAAAVKAASRGDVIGEVKPAGEYDPMANVITERAHVNGKGNGAHTNGANR